MWYPFELKSGYLIRYWKGRYCILKILLYPTTVKDILHIDIQSSETMKRPPIIRFFDVMGRPIQSYRNEDLLNF
ncbi:MAG: hypothetical protein AAF849_23315 [Bacteroidota bacterium]